MPPSITFIELYHLLLVIGMWSGLFLFSLCVSLPLQHICTGILKTASISFGLFAAAFYLFFNEAFMKFYIVHFSAYCNSKRIYY